VHLPQGRMSGFGSVRFCAGQHYLTARSVFICYTTGMSRRINVRGIIVQDGKLFVVRHRRDDDEPNFWCTPGGGLEDFESLEDGMRRELLEETGVQAHVGRLLFVQQFRKPPDQTYPYDEFLEFFFAIDNPEDFVDIDLANSTHGQQELVEFGFVDPTQVDDILPNFIKTVELTSTKNSPMVFDEL
jgi:8-oxo-dGTP pyrophosphatase MutT (NUDIX family)